MKIGVIGAMDLEIDLIVKALQNKEKVDLYGFVFYKGQVSDNEVVVVKSGIGKVSASVATTLLIKEFFPDLIINTGVAGGLRNTKIYDIVLASSVSYYDVDLTVFGYQLGQQSSMPAVFQSNEKWLNLAKENILKYTKNLYCGQVVSGDSFINQPEKRFWIEENFPESLAVEMESGAIAQTCHILKVDFLIIRSISDSANEKKAEDYKKFVNQAGKLSAEININFIKNIV